MSDDVRPGEVELEGAPAPVAVVEPEPAAEPAAEPVVAAAEPEPEPAAEPAAPAAAKKQSMLEELITERTLRKQAEGRLREVTPILQRLTPDVQQALNEGRLQIQPPQSNQDLEKQRLEQVANDLGLLKADNTPDLDAARRVDRYVRGTVQAAVEPVRNLTLAEKAHQNLSVALQYAAAQKMPKEAIDIIEATYREVLAQPNGAQVLSQAEVATTLWHQGLGRALAQGKLKGAAAPPAPEPSPAVLVADPPGRRGAAAIALSPALQRVYRDHGMDPTAASANKPPAVDSRGHMELE